MYSEIASSPAPGKITCFRKRHKERVHVRAAEVAQWVKAVVTKPENLNSIPRTYMKEGEDTDIHMHAK